MKSRKLEQRPEDGWKVQMEGERERKKWSTDRPADCRPANKNKNHAKKDNAKRNEREQDLICAQKFNKFRSTVFNVETNGLHYNFI